MAADRHPEEQKTFPVSSSVHSQTINGVKRVEEIALFQARDHRRQTLRITCDNGNIFMLALDGDFTPVQGVERADNFLESSISASGDVVFAGDTISEGSDNG